MQHIKLYTQFNESVQPMRIFCDMDGVLSDWDSQFEKEAGMTIEEFQKEYSKNASWKLVGKAGEEFWAGMEWMTDGIDLWSFIRKFNPTILSSPSLDPKSITGKAKWLKKNLNWDFPYITKIEDWTGKEKIIFYGNKFEFATGPQDILIDDTPKKLDAWIAAGGTGILHTSAKETIAELKKLGFDK
jgi:hypothetical protein